MALVGFEVQAAARLDSSHPFGNDLERATIRPELPWFCII
jgi:hypothetical protein